MEKIIVLFCVLILNGAKVYSLLLFRQINKNAIMYITHLLTYIF